MGSRSRPNQEANGVAGRRKQKERQQDEAMEGSRAKVGNAEQERPSKNIFYDSVENRGGTLFNRRYALIIKFNN